MKVWFQLGVVGSALWSLMTFILSDNVLGPTSFSSFYFLGDQGNNILLAGWCVVWVMSYLFFKDKE
jgi:hypothetical protein